MKNILLLGFLIVQALVLIVANGKYKYNLIG